MRRFLSVVSGKGALALVLGMILLQGCTLGKQGFGDYFKYRYQDACEIFEFGFTYSETPQFAFYMDGVSACPFGYADIDGYYYGLGGGQLGKTRHSVESYGLFLWGQETIGWGKDGSSDGPLMKNTQGAGMVGATIGPNGLLGHLDVMPPGAGPDYMPSCLHYIHLGWAGMVLNLRYTQMFDFMLGCFFVDFAGDDGYQVGEWTLTPREGPEPESPATPLFPETGKTEPPKLSK